MERTIHISAGTARLATTLHYPALSGKEAGRLPAIIICHGFVGNRIGTNRLFVKAARHLCSQGWLVVRFDYAGCGESEGDYGSSGMDEWIKQTRYVLDYVLDMDVVDAERVTLLGHSLGGATALLTAARDRRVRSLVLWAPVAHPFSDIVRITGKTVYDAAATSGTGDYMGYELTPQFFESLIRHQPLQEGTAFAGDLLLVHGTADEVIPADYTFIYQKVFWTRQEGQCDKEVVLQADHTFSSGSAQDTVIHRTAHWLAQSEERSISWDGWMI